MGQGRDPGQPGASGRRGATPGLGVGRGVPGASPTLGAGKTGEAAVAVTSLCPALSQPGDSDNCSVSTSIKDDGLAACRGAGVSRGGVNSPSGIPFPRRLAGPRRLRVCGQVPSPAAATGRADSCAECSAEPLITPWGPHLCFPSYSDNPSHRPHGPAGGFHQGVS